MKTSELQIKSTNSEVEHEKRRYNIKDEMAYFNKVKKNMDCKEKIKQSEIENNEIFVEDPAIYSDFIGKFDLDKELADRNLLGWIDMIEDQKLHAAVKSLPIEEQTLLSYIFEKEKTQTDVAKIYKVKQQSMCERVDKIINKLKNNL